MSNPTGTITDDEVREIALLIETLDKSTFDFLQLEVGSLKVTIAKGSPPPANGVTVSVPASTLIAEPGSPTAPPAAATAAPAATIKPPPEAPKDARPAQDGTVAITAPIIGRFYAQPEPGAAPFVSVGAEVNENTTVGLIEVMKTFNAIPAGVSGVIAEVCVQDAQLVEFGQMLFRVRTASPAKGSLKGSRT